MKNKKIAYVILPILVIALAGASDASAHGWFGSFSKATPEEVATRQQEMFDSKASLLGINVEDVKNAWAKGMSMSELATANGISDEELRTRMQNAKIARMTEFMQTLVDRKVITQSQADQRLQLMQTRLNEGGMMKMGGRHMMGFGRGFGF